jgi:hypothetical protein
MGTGAPSNRAFATRFHIVGAVIIWAIALGAGLIAMTRYETTPGAAAVSRPEWPVGTSLARHGDRPTLVMFAHPRCPCTNASISQLAEIIASAGQSVTAYVIFYAPAHADASWHESDTWKDVAAIPGVTAVRDDDGAEAHRFGAYTSGQVLVFNAAGSLVFEGGVTGARGQVGDNAGSKAVAAVLHGQPPPVHQTPVFGCELFARPTCPLCDNKEAP